MGRGTALDLIQAMAEIHPNGSLVAAMIRLALEDSLGGDGGARIWLGNDDCGRWLSLVVPGGLDERAVQAALIRLVEDERQRAPAIRARQRPGIKRRARKRNPNVPVRPAAPGP